MVLVKLDEFPVTRTLVLRADVIRSATAPHGIIAGTTYRTVDPVCEGTCRRIIRHPLANFPQWENVAPVLYAFDLVRFGDSEKVGALHGA